MNVRFVSGWNTAQPITFFARYDVGGADVLIRFGGPAQTWDCQPYRRQSRILAVGGVPPTPEQERLYGEALRRAYPGAECFNDLAVLDDDEERI